MNKPENYIFGKFIREEKNRFLCTIEIDGSETLCYIASSCRLTNFINLNGKTVMLVPTRGPKAKKEYAVFAVKFKRSFILLNTSMANYAVANSMHSKKLSCFGKRETVLREHTVGGYKADFYIPDSKTIVEVKSVIATSDDAIFPSVFSERTVRQLSTIKQLLKLGYTAHFVIVALNPYVKRISLLPNSPIYCALESCISCGLKLEAFTCRLGQDGVPYLDKCIPIVFPDASEQPAKNE